MKLLKNLIQFIYCIFGHPLRLYYNILRPNSGKKDNTWVLCTVAFLYSSNPMRNTTIFPSVSLIGQYINIVSHFHKSVYIHFSNNVSPFVFIYLFGIFFFAFQITISQTQHVLIIYMYMKLMNYCTEHYYSM